MIQKILEKLNRYTVTMLLFLTVIFVCLIKMAAVIPDWYTDVKKNVKKVVKQEDYAWPEVLNTAIGVTEDTFNENVIARMQLIDFYGLFNLVIGKRMIPEGNALRNVYKMDNGQLTFAYPEHGVETAAKNMKVMREVCKENGTRLLYIQWPFKIDKYDNQLPYGIVDEANPNADRFLGRLEDLKIDYLDYRDVMHDSGKDYASQFYVTDHHWRTKTAFEAYVYLLSFLNKNYGFEYDAQNADARNFNFVNMPQSFIGSQANQVGKWYAGVDDFVYIYPKFDTEFTWTKFSLNQSPDLVREGRFEDTILFSKALENPEKAMTYRDNCYFNGNPALARIENKNLADGKKILFIVDSFSKPIVSFMALNAKEADFMDPRDFNKKPIAEYVAEEDYDYVIIAYTLNAFKGASYKHCFTFTVTKD